LQFLWLFWKLTQGHQNTHIRAGRVA
jgi:hypothetical protein